MMISKPFSVAVLVGVLVAGLVAGLVLTVSPVSAQQQVPQSVTFQLPVRTFHTVNTVVSIPDGGTMNLGGISRSSAGQSSLGTPLIGGAPVAGRPFNSRGYGSSASASGTSASVQIIINREIEEDVMAIANQRELASESFDPNGPRAVQSQADFLSRNMGR